MNKQSIKDGGDWIKDIEDFKMFAGIDKAEDKREKEFSAWLLDGVDIHERFGYKRHARNIFNRSVNHWKMLGFKINMLMIERECFNAT